MASTDAKPVPQKNVAYRATFPIYDADGDLVTGATGLDSEISKDAGTFADCTNEATEIATSSGIYYLDLTSTEMNADCVSIIVKTSSSGAKTTVLVFYPEEAGDMRVNVTNWLGTAASTPTVAGIPKVEVASMNDSTIAANTFTANSGLRPIITGTAAAGTANSITLDASASSSDGTYDPGLVRISSGTGAGQARLILNYAGSTKVATVDRDWRTAPDATSVYEISPTTNLLSTNEGIAAAGNSTTITLNSTASSTDDVYTGQLVVIRSGVGQDQSRIITGYVGSTKVATVASPWAINVSSSSVYMILPEGRTQVTAFTSEGIVAMADGILDRSAGVETGLTVRQALRLMASALYGKASGLATTTAVFRDFGDTKARITATVDADGNRSALTLDAS